MIHKSKFSDIYLNDFSKRVSELEVTSILTKRHNPKTNKTEYCLVSKKDHSKILKWFGTKKPSKESVLHEEKRVQYFKHKKAVFFFAGSCMVSPDGKEYGLGQIDNNNYHAEWCAKNANLIGLDPQEFVLDRSGYNRFNFLEAQYKLYMEALKEFLKAGWIRIARDTGGYFGIEAWSLNTLKNPKVLPLIKSSIAGSGGQSVSIDITSSSESIVVPKTYTGRADFSDLDARLGISGDINGTKRAIP